MAKAPFSVRLFHGRDDPFAGGLEEWGFEGPVLGPLVSVGFTYGSLILYTEQHERIELPLIGDVLHYDGKFYGDSEIALASELAPTEQVDEARTIPGPRVVRPGRPAPVPINREALHEYRGLVDVFIDGVIEHLNETTASACYEALRRTTLDLPSRG